MNTSGEAVETDDAAGSEVASDGFAAVKKLRVELDGHSHGMGALRETPSADARLRSTLCCVFWLAEMIISLALGMAAVGAEANSDEDMDWKGKAVPGQVAGE